jgi:hypothetical protein
MGKERDYYARYAGERNQRQNHRLSIEFQRNTPAMAIPSPAHSPAIAEGRRHSWGKRCTMW